MPKGFKSAFIAELIAGECNDKDVYVDNFSSLSSANKSSVCFYNDPKYKKDLLSSSAALVILKKNDSDLFDGPKIFVSDPYLAFGKVSSLFQNSEIDSEIDNSAIIKKNVSLGSEVAIGAFSLISHNSLIGNNSQIGACVFIGENVTIGRNTKIHSNVTINSNVVIGDNCEFFSGARIGTDGFGYARDKDKSWIKIPQTGSVIIGNNVDIGANSTIDRGALDNTIIGDGVKIDNLVQVGHNCIIGENTIIAGCAGIAGSTVIGKNCMIGGAAMISGHITIADDTIISGGTGIGKNVDDSGKRFTNVFPYNIEHKDWLRIANNLKKIGKKND